jgi:3-hydroxyisobutyrate dehydrogenase
MAGHLAAKGHAVTVWNRSRKRPLAWVARHGQDGRHRRARRPTGPSSSWPASATTTTCGRSALAPRVPLPAWRRGDLCRPHHGFGQRHPRTGGACRSAGAGLCRCAGFGRAGGGRERRSSIMCGGTAADYARAEPVMAAYARICRRLGDSGAGQMAKMMNQICIAGLMQGLSEALAFGEKAGLDGEKRGRGDQPGRRRILADGEPAQDHAGGSGSTSASRWTGCARI